MAEERRNYTGGTGDKAVIPDDEVKVGCDALKRAQFGKLLGRRFDHAFVARDLSRCWQITNEFDVFPFSHGYYILRFAKDEDLMKVRVRGP